MSLVYVSPHSIILDEKNKKIINFSFYINGKESDFARALMDRLAVQWSVGPEPTVEMKVDQLTSIVNRYAEEIEILKKQIDIIQNNKSALAVIDAQKIEVDDYSPDIVETCKEKILNLLQQRESIDPWDYADETHIDVGLALLCFDELIDEGKLERAR